MKVGRNDPCPCGSGKKYKKCCSPKYDQPGSTAKTLFERAWTADKLAAMSEADIVDKLDEMGIRTDQAQFVKDARGHISACEISDKWMSRIPPAPHVLDEEFPLLAATELWNRWLPDQFAMHHLEAKLKKYLYEELDGAILEQFWGIWTAIRDHILIPFKYRSFVQFVEPYDFPYEMDAVFFDTEGKMVRECRKRKDPEAWDRLIQLYREMMEYLPDMDEHNRLNLRRSYAEAHFYKGEAGTADTLFEQLTEEHPEWVWGYVGWGDLYNPQFDSSSAGSKDKALRLYQSGLDKASSDKDVLEERIVELIMQ
ncbi:hypothetical protein PGRAT_04455 [Paenibacillus graminis]|uniref:SEC-C motif-containing protein n=1 Tax=Paenibacillus graminis TaxID=189425 RepID=A0A089M3N5_9BACL|nr:SEC-C metal-binding domain-containing protein [Paenibacillus graminis]AIQ66980.1 hypothetical protein PGRAT_04455 [Paenibacillus graminis]